MADKKEVDKEKDEQVAEEETAVTGEKKKILIYILAGVIGVVILVGAMIATAFFVSSKVRDENVGKTKEVTEQTAAAYVPPMETFLLSKDPLNFNLKPDERGKSRVIQIGITFAFDDKALKEELDKRKDQVMDILVKFFGTKSAEEVQADKMGAVKQQLLNEFNGIINSKKYKIKDIYFWTYLIGK